MGDSAGPPAGAGVQIFHLFCCQQDNRGYPVHAGPSVVASAPVGTEAMRQSTLYCSCRGSNAREQAAVVAGGIGPPVQTHQPDCSVVLPVWHCWF